MMLPGGTLGVKLVVRSPGTDHTWPCVKVIPAAHAWGHTDSSMTFFHEQAYTEYLYVQVISTIARGKSRE